MRLTGQAANLKRTAAESIGMAKGNEPSLTEVPAVMHLARE